MDDNSIRNLRDSLYLTQDDLALLLGISRSTLARAETGESLIPRTCIPWIESLVMAYKHALIASGDSYSSSKTFGFISLITPSMVPGAWSRILAMAHPRRAKEGFEIGRKAVDIKIGYLSPPGGEDEKEAS